MQASVVAFGAWAIGGWKWGGADADASVKAVQASLDAGVDLIDTAAVYGFGLSEEIVGKAIEGRDRRRHHPGDQVRPALGYRKPRVARRERRATYLQNTGRASIRWELEQSLAQRSAPTISISTRRIGRTLRLSWPRWWRRWTRCETKGRYAHGVCATSRPSVLPKQRTGSAKYRPGTLQPAGSRAGHMPTCPSVRSSIWVFCATHRLPRAC